MIQKSRQLSCVTSHIQNVFKILIPPLFLSTSLFNNFLRFLLSTLSIKIQRIALTTLINTVQHKEQRMLFSNMP